MKALIIDDEFYCADTLGHLIKAHCPEITEFRLMTNPLEALDYLRNNPVDVLFLDVEMPHLSGFDLLKQATGFNGSVIFSTAFGDYALDAFRVDAISYLLKPVDKTELKKAVEKAVRQNGKANHQELVQMIQQSLGSKISTLKKVPLPTLEGIHMLPLDEIVHCESDGSYSRIHSMHEKTLMVSKNLRELEDLFNSPRFFRIHKSHLINLDHIKFVTKQDGGDVMMANNSSVPISRNAKQDFFNMLKAK
jgi:two-component system, LytTR family, response regulator